MEPLGLAVMALYGAGLYLLGRSRHNDRVRIWRIAAERCGLVNVQESSNLVGVTELTGWAEQLRVRLSTYRRGKTERGTAIEIENTAADLAWLVSLRRETMATSLQKRVLGAKEVELGDEAFDADYFVDGPPALVRAVFDADTRRTLRWLLTDVELEVANGRLRAELAMRGVSRSTIGDLPQVLPRLLEAARRLGRPDDVPRRLATVADTDPLPAVRREALATLTREYPGRPETREALVAGGKDPDPEIRVRAALALGVDGRPILLELATYGPDVYAARAIAILDRHLPRESCVSILENALRARNVETAQACLATLGRIGGSEGLALLVKTLRREDGELGAAAARALGAIGLAAGEEPLIKALRRTNEVRVAAAEALGRFASVAAVLPLKEAEADPPRHEAFRRAARTAIARIQARATGASPGQLSLSAGESGQLSLAAEDTGGRLSLPPEQPHKEDPRRR